MSLFILRRISYTGFLIIFLLFQNCSGFEGKQIQSRQDTNQFNRESVEFEISPLNDDVTPGSSAGQNTGAGIDIGTGSVIDTDTDTQSDSTTFGTTVRCDNTAVALIYNSDTELYFGWMPDGNGGGQSCHSETNNMDNSDNSNRPVASDDEVSNDDTMPPNSNNFTGCDTNKLTSPNPITEFFAHHGGRFKPAILSSTFTVNGLIVRAGQDIAYIDAPETVQFWKKVFRKKTIAFEIHQMADGEELHSLRSGCIRDAVRIHYRYTCSNGLITEEEIVVPDANCDIESRN